MQSLFCLFWIAHVVPLSKICQWLFVIAAESYEVKWMKTDATSRFVYKASVFC